MFLSIVMIYEVNSMKKIYKILIVVVVLLLLSVGLIFYVCNRVVVRPQASSFSYAEEMKDYEAQLQEILRNLPDGIDQETAGFFQSNQYHNTEFFEIHSFEDAIELAKKECTVEYNIIEYAYDEESNIWRIWFRIEERLCFGEWLGGDQVVYIRGDGVTQMVTYGK